MRKYVTDIKTFREWCDSGRELHIDGYDSYYTEVDGIIYYHYGNGAIEAGTAVEIVDHEGNSKWYYEDGAVENIIDAPGLYKCRNGEQAYVSCILSDYCIGVIEKCSTFDKWFLDGKTIAEHETEFDIVSKWKE